MKTLVCKEGGKDRGYLRGDETCKMMMILNDGRNVLTHNKPNNLQQHEDTTIKKNTNQLFYSFCIEYLCIIIIIITLYY